MKLLFFFEKALHYLFWILTALAFDKPHIAILTMLSAALHELGHIGGFLIACNGSSFNFKSRLSGPKLNIRGISYKEELFIVACGPLINIAAGTVFFIIFAFIRSEYLLHISIINFMTAISNLLPVAGFDGYKILYCYLANRRTPFHLFDALYWFSFIVTALLEFISLYFLLKLGEGYWTFVLFLSILINEISKRQKLTF